MNKSGIGSFVGEGSDKRTYHHLSYSFLHAVDPPYRMLNVVASIMILEGSGNP